MTLRRLLFVLTFFGSLAILPAQDIHYTLHNMSPLWLNPAETGGFYGSVRVGGIYRGQWHGTNGINSPSVYADAPLIRGFRKQDWIGAGFMLISDKAGGDEIITTISGFSASYHLSLDKKQQNVLTLGVQYGSVNFGFNPRMNFLDQNTIGTNVGGRGQLQSEQFGTNTTNPNPNPNNRDQGPRQTLTDINAGLMFRATLDEKANNKLEIGVAMLRINSDDYRAFTTRDTVMNPPPDQVGGSNDAASRERKPTIHAHANLDYELTEKLRFLPTVFYQGSAGQSSVSLQAWVGAQLKDDMLFKFGLGYRTGDAGKILVGLDKDRLRVAASYDIPLSQATPTFNLGSINSFEIAANYIFNIYKKPEVKPNILCPRI